MSAREIIPTTGQNANVSKNHASAHEREENSSWRLEPHVCRVCFSRISSRKHGDARLYQCTNCGLEGIGHKPSVVCSCGLKIRKSKGDGRTAATFADAGVRCHENKAISPEFPSLYVCSYAGAQEVD